MRHRTFLLLTTLAAVCLPGLKAEQRDLQDLLQDVAVKAIENLTVHNST